MSNNLLTLESSGKVFPGLEPSLIIISGQKVWINETGHICRLLSAFAEIITGAAQEACTHLRVLAGNNHLFVDNTAIQPASSAGEHMWAVGITPGEHKELAAGGEIVYTGEIPTSLYIPPAAEVKLELKGAGALSGLAIALERLG